jgi:hypothetical protein
MERFADWETGTGFASAKLSEIFRLRSRCSLLKMTETARDQ